MPLAAQYALVRRRYLLAEDVGIEAPAPRIVERGVAVQESRERGPLRLVDLRQDRPAREYHDLRRARLERFGGIVKGRGAGAEDADAFSFERGEIEVIGRMEHSRTAAGGIEGREFRPAQRPAAFAAHRQHRFARVNGFLFG